MDSLFSGIGQMVREGGERLVAVHNAVVDVAYHIPLTMEEYRSKLGSMEQRFDGPKVERIGGGGINFALSAASLGVSGAMFVGFMDRCARCLVERIKKASGLRLPLVYNKTGPRRNTIIELDDGNILFHDSAASVFDVPGLMAKLGGLGLGPDDWLASCSFYEPVTFPLLSMGQRLFLDSGYGYPRREKMMASRLVARMRECRLRDFVIAANEREMENLASEFGVDSGPLVSRALRVSKRMSDASGNTVDVLLHTASFSTMAGPMDSEPWAMPSFDVSVRRRTNAGDTFAGAFISAYSATGDPQLSAFFGNAATAKRLADDELPTGENVAAFLRRARLREGEIPGALESRLSI
jgi:sugar/nucleoside kinase (ribokinase family)